MCSTYMEKAAARDFVERLEKRGDRFCKSFVIFLRKFDVYLQQYYLDWESKGPPKPFDAVSSIMGES